VWRAVWLLVVIGCASRVESGAVSVSGAANEAIFRVWKDDTFLPGEVQNALSAPGGIAVGIEGTLYIADTGHHRVQVRRRDGALLLEVGVFGWRLGELDTPTDVAVASGQRLVYISERGNRRIQRWNLLDDTKTILFDSSTDRAFEPVALAVGRNGDLFVADVGGRRLWRLTSRGSVEWMRGGYGDPGETLREPWGICVDANGDAVVADAGEGRIVRFDFVGNLAASWRLPGVVEEPVAVAVDRAGRTYVCDRKRPRVVVLDAAGNVLTAFGDGLLQEPSDIVVTSEGEIYVADREANRVWRFRTSHEETTQHANRR